MTHTGRTVCRLFLLVLLTGCVCGLNLTVWQTPRHVTAVSGERVDITCHFTLWTSRAGELKIQWRKNNHTVVLNEAYDISNIKPNISTHVNKSHTLTFHSVNESHSGVYYCSVWQDVPVLITKTEAGGTELIVNSTVGNNTVNTDTADQDEKSVIWMAVLGSALILVCVTSLIFCVHRASDYSFINFLQKLSTDRCMKEKNENQTAQTDDLGVVYAAVKIHKHHEKKTTQEASDAPDVGCAADRDEVLYSDIRIKSL